VRTVGPMAQRDRDREVAHEVARHVTRLVQQGADVVEAYLASSPSGIEVQNKARREAIERHERKVRRYEKRMADSKRGFRTMSIASLGLGAGGIVDLVANVVPGPTPTALFVASALAALSARSKRRFVRESKPPSQPELPSAAPPRLPSGAIGQVEAEQFARVRKQLVDLIPSLSGIHPDAGRELKNADGEAGSALAGLVQRLALLDRIRTDLAGSQAAAAATTAADDVRERLAEGVETYDRLLAAAATMLAAPDMGRTSIQVLGPAIEALTAYAHGLEASAETFRPEL
jgi:hypothetical protein